MGEWKKIRFGDLYAIPSRNGVSKPSRVRGAGYKMINMGELFAHNWIFDIPMELVPLNDSEKANSQVVVDDLLFARQSMVASGAGRCVIVREVNELTVFESHLIRVRLDQAKALPLFYYYYFRSGCSNIASIVQHVVQAGIRASDLSDLEVDLPDLPTQRRIAAVLGALDDKIEVNRKICENLEAQAQALFKAWFVDFEPFGGKRPEGWKMGKLGDVATYYDGKIEATKLTFTSYFSTENMLANREGAVDAETVPQSGMVPLCDEGCVLVSNIRPYFKKIIRVNCDGGHSPDVLCFKAKALEWQWYLYRMLWDDAFFAYVMSSTKGTKMPRGDKGHIMDYPCVLPLANDIRKFNDTLASLNGRIEVAKRESRALAAMRDALLPKLMSGELAVEKVEGF